MTTGKRRIEKLETGLTPKQVFMLWLKTLAAMFNPRTANHVAVNQLPNQAPPWLAPLPEPVSPRQYVAESPAG